MSRRYTKVKEIEKEVMELKASGKTNCEIAEIYGLEKSQIKGLIKRQNRKRQKIEAGITPRPKGRPRKQPPTDEAEKEKYIKRLEMENKLLRDFHHLAGRK